jgi:hypothetical protein
MNSWHPAAPFPHQLPSKTTSHRGDYPFSHSLPTEIPSKLLRQPRNLVIVELILSSPILFTAGIHFRLFFSTTKVCPDSLNLSNAGDPFAGISSISSCYLFFPDQGLDCFSLESSRVFSVRFPKLSLFQINELIHFIDFRKGFIKVQNQFCLKP